MFPSEWKKENIVLVQKKTDKQNTENHRPVSPLAICGKIFERLTINEMFNYFSANKPISKNQSGFQPGDYCIIQRISITHEILTLKLEVFS